MFARTFSGWILIATVTVLMSCGGGGSGSAGDQATGGIWIGDWTGGASGIEAALAYSTDVDASSGEAQFSMLLYPSRIQIAGTGQIDGTRIAGSGTAYTQPGDFFPGGGTTTGFSFTGTLREAQTLSGDWTIDAGESGSFSLAYQQEHLRGAELASLNGIWTLYDIDDEFNAIPLGTFDILDGRIFRQTADCTSEGTITIPDPQLNMYGWAATVTSNTPGSCFIEGDYTGLSALVDSDETSPVPLNDEFDVLVSSATLAIPLKLILEPQ